MKIVAKAGATKSIWSLNEAPRLQAANHALKNFRELGHVIGQAVALHAIAKAEIWVAEVNALGIIQEWKQRLLMTLAPARPMGGQRSASAVQRERERERLLKPRDSVGYMRVIASIVLWFLHRVRVHVRYLYIRNPAPARWSRI